MRKSRFTTEQIVGFLKEQEAKAKVKGLDLNLGHPAAGTRASYVLS